MEARSQLRHRPTSLSSLYHRVVSLSLTVPFCAYNEQCFEARAFPFLIALIWLGFRPASPGGG